MNSLGKYISWCPDAKAALGRCAASRARGKASTPGTPPQSVLRWAPSRQTTTTKKSWKTAIMLSHPWGTLYVELFIYDKRSLAISVARLNDTAFTFQMFIIEERGPCKVGACMCNGGAQRAAAGARRHLARQSEACRPSPAGVGPELRRGRDTHRLWYTWGNYLYFICTKYKWSFSLTIL